jgi:transposase-like protein
MPKKQPRYSPAVQRNAVEQVVRHHTPVAHVARQLGCSDQSVQRWLKVHRKSLPPPNTSTNFLPIRVDGQPPLASNIEVVTKSGLTLRFPVDTPSDTLVDVVRSLEGVSC